MADRINAECRIQHGEGTTDACEEEAAYPPHHPVVEKPDRERGGEPAKDEDCIVPMLPNGHRINRDTRGIFGIGVRVWGHQPSAVAMPESQSGIIRVFLAVAVRMVAKMISGPFDGGVLQSPGPSNQKCGLHPVRAVETAVGHEAVITDCDSEAADEIEKSK